jgi:hypothetical protein
VKINLFRDLASRRWPRKNAAQSYIKQKDKPILPTSIGAGGGSFQVSIGAFGSRKAGLCLQRSPYSFAPPIFLRPLGSLEAIFLTGLSAQLCQCVDRPEVTGTGLDNYPIDLS